MKKNNLLSSPLKDILDLDILEKETLDLSYTLESKQLAPLIETIHQEIVAYFKKNKKITPRSFLGTTAVKKILKAVAENIVLDEKSEKAVRSIIHSNYIKNLFGETIHVAIVSFYKKVNPLFGGLATSMLEKQIRGAIDFVINMVLDVAVSFILNPKNQAMFSEFIEGLLNEVLDVPVYQLLETLSHDQVRYFIDLGITLSNDNTLQASNQKLIKHLLPKLVRILKNSKVIDFIELKNDLLLSLIYQAA